jgi:tetratricopeptide (TPR) repeat protein
MFKKLKRTLNKLTLNETQLQEKAIACFETGKISYDKHKIHDAIENLKQAIGLNPNYVEALCLLGNAYSANNDYDEAFTSFQKAISIHAECVEAYFGLSRIYIQNPTKYHGDLVRSCYEKVLEIEPDNVEALQELAFYYHNKGDYAEEVRIRQKLPERDTVENLVALANAHRAAGEYDEAIAICRQAIEKQPDSAPAYHCLAEIFFTKKDYQQALANYKKAVERDEGYRYGQLISDIYYRLGETGANSGDYDAAIAYFDNALAYGEEQYSRCKREGDVVIYRKLAEIYRLKGDVAQADKLEGEAYVIEHGIS